MLFQWAFLHAQGNQCSRCWEQRLVWALISQPASQPASVTPSLHPPLVQFDYLTERPPDPTYRLERYELFLQSPHGCAECLLGRFGHLSQSRPRLLLICPLKERVFFLASGMILLVSISWLYVLLILVNTVTWYFVILLLVHQLNTNETCVCVSNMMT